MPENWKMDVLGVCGTVSGISSGSGGDWSSVSMKEMRSFLREKLDNWKPSLLNRMKTYDDAVKNLIVATLETSQDE